MIGATCVICNENPASINYVGCNHTCVCGKCIVRTVRSGCKCPICDEIPLFLSGYDNTASNNIIALINRGFYHNVEKCKKFTFSSLVDLMMVIVSVFMLPFMIGLMLFIFDSSNILITGSSIELNTNYTFIDISVPNIRTLPSLGVVYRFSGYELGLENTLTKFLFYFRKQRNGAVK